MNKFLMYKQTPLVNLSPKPTVYTQVKLPPLVPPMYLGETGKSSPLPFTRGGLGWGNLRNNGNPIAKRSVGIICVYTVALEMGEIGKISSLPNTSGRVRVG